ncbi:hypothetical protein [Lichenicoccus sp.]|uniref:hypothetical protein n=1 Tax=Lichenicoccus sp. TaxID=2781899 RepID=UPI003D1518D6
MQSKTITHPSSRAVASLVAQVGFASWMLCVPPAVASPAGAAAAALALPAGCGSATATSARRIAAAAGKGAAFEASALRIQLPLDATGHPPSFAAAALHVASHGAETGPEALERASTAAGASLLIALTGTGRSKCPADALQAASYPVVDGLLRGGGYLATWQDVALRGTAGHVLARRMQLRLDGAGGAAADAPVHMTLSLDGITGTLTPPTLLPEHLSVSATLPASSLPTLLSAAGGAAPDARIPVTIDDISMSRGSATLHGTGTANAAATPQDSSAEIHLVAHAFDALVNEAALQDMTRVHAALFLSRLMARQAGANLEWQLKYGAGLLSVNDVPIPLR